MSLSLLAFLLTGVLAAAASSDESIEVKVRGTLHAGMMAIGGETTGYTITARGATWELDLGRRKDLHQKADALDGKTVVVTGTLEARPGVEIPTRWIVTVETLTAADATK
jgi:hypothetical protein